MWPTLIVKRKSRYRSTQTPATEDLRGAATFRVFHRPGVHLPRCFDSQGTDGGWRVKLRSPRSHRVRNEISELRKVEAILGGKQ